ncbi:MAG: efflux RND transporter periplasmic adaptor subunit [Proteobacteria bacterium]|nr:efflux RND transporter periplasmic adaptor subunit [Pseudomonadota bacterium]
MQDRSDKLHSLKINRSDEGSESPGGIGRTKIILFASLAVIAAAALWVLLPVTDETPGGVDKASNANAGIKSSTSSSADNQTQSTSAQSQQILNASGYITARRKATVSAEITGRILEIFIEEGTVVEKGQIVAKLDDTLAKVDLDLAKARVRSAEARISEIEVDLAEAKRVLARTEELIKTQIASQAALTKAQARVDTLKSSYERAAVDIDIAKLEVTRQRETVEKYVIRAPFDGVVVGKNAQPGEMISPVSAGGGFTRTGICTIVDMDSLEIEVDVNESYIGRVFAGQKVLATLDSYPDWDIPAAVIAVVPTANRDKATVKVRISLGVKDPRILPDMGVKVAFLKEPD